MPHNVPMRMSITHLFLRRCLCHCCWPIPSPNPACPTPTPWGSSATNKGARRRPILAAGHKREKRKRKIETNPTQAQTSLPCRVNCLCCHAHHAHVCVGREGGNWWHGSLSGRTRPTDLTRLDSFRLVCFFVFFFLFVGLFIFFSFLPVWL